MSVMVVALIGLHSYSLEPHIQAHLVLRGGGVLRGCRLLCLPHALPGGPSVPRRALLRSWGGPWEGMAGVMCLPIGPLRVGAAPVVP